MNTDIEKIVTQLKNMGICEGDALMVHSSYKSLGGVDGGIDTVISGLKLAVGESGTIMMPTFTYEYVNASNPIFDIKNTPSCTGMISEIFRHGEGVVRSLHPTHSLAVWGNDKDYYVGDHWLDKNCLDKNSPIYKLMMRGGKILLIGCPTEKLTLLHGLEIAKGAPYAFKVDYSDPKYHRDYTCIDENGKRYCSEFYHVFSKGVGYAHDFNKLSGIVELNKQKLFCAECYLFNAKKLWDSVSAAMDKDPYCLATKIDII